VENARKLDPPSEWNLDPEHSGDLLRLERLLRGRLTFTLAVLQYGDSHYRDRVIRHLDRSWKVAARVDAREAEGDFAILEARLAEAAGEKGAVHLFGLEGWPGDLRSFWRGLNYHRERIAELCPVPFLLWIPVARLRDLALEAPDFWAWRSGVFDFTSRPAPTARVFLEGTLDRGRSSAADRTRRIEEIDGYLAKLGEPSYSADLRLLLERGSLQEDLGDLDGALESYQGAAAGYDRIDDLHGEAWARRRTANVLATRGDPKKALRILREEVLPIFERLGDVHARAIIMDQIAGILDEMGEQDQELLRILREEVLPVFERLGDPRSKAVATGKIAYILARQGRFVEALRILHEEVLAVFEQLGDVHAQAVTMDRIADILEHLGELDRSQRIRREALTLVEQLGDVYERATASAKLGSLLYKLGRKDEAVGLLTGALRDAERLKIPAAAAIRDELEEIEGRGPRRESR
jgi:tetratricopeptide (TPR) repeat protein